MWILFKPTSSCSSGQTRPHCCNELISLSNRFIQGKFTFALMPHVHWQPFFPVSHSWRATIVREGNKGVTLALHCLIQEVTMSSPAHSLLAKASHMIYLNHKGSCKVLLGMTAGPCRSPINRACSATGGCSLTGQVRCRTKWDARLWLKHSGNMPEPVALSSRVLILSGLGQVFSYSDFANGTVSFFILPELFLSQEKEASIYLP